MLRDCPKVYEVFKVLWVQFYRKNINKNLLEQEKNCLES
ncbi:hypothetical protein HCAN_1208 [Helicobacter canadensis MIT 98-5491]|uniref:Uncharacterized protein n=1 Tax=Helicobacter canadensis MIT 98-5491 TaxID=537970 RepID=C5ZXQ0_9HELI|nr:hypothetical protein HCAN_1208 [Helicobacter canadensis MIT 98-5491]